MGNRLIFGKRYEYNNEYFESPLKFGCIEMHQVGELFCEAGFTVPLHTQHVFEISYIVTGRGMFVVDGIECPVAESDVFINTKGQTHLIKADQGDPLRFCYLAFTFDNDPAKFDAELVKFYETHHNIIAYQNKDMLTPYSEIFNELRNKDCGFMTMVSGYVEQIIVMAFRTFQKNHKTANISQTGDNCLGNAVYSVMRYIDQHYRDTDDISKVAQKLGYSYTYLAHEFKKKMDMTIGGYILQKKMEEAKRLLQTGRMNVSQVAERMNYLSVQSFSKSFKETVGMSPAEYKNIQICNKAAEE